MELIFDHSLGKQEHQDLVICRPMAMVDVDEEHEAVDHQVEEEKVDMVLSTAKVDQ